LAYTKLFSNLLLGFGLSIMDKLTEITGNGVRLWNAEVYWLPINRRGPRSVVRGAGISPHDEKKCFRPIMSRIVFSAIMAEIVFGSGFRP